MPVPIPDELIHFIESGSKFIVAGHKEPDGDCVGSQLALCSALRRLGKEALPFSAGPFKRTEIMRYAKLFGAMPTDAEREGAKLIVVDCFGLKRTGELEPGLSGLPAAIIDHHETGETSPFCEAVFSDPDAPSTTYMVLAVIEALGLTLTKEEADLLLFGLCTDTGFFRHVDSGGAETFTRAARLVQAGASPKDAFDAINGGKSLNSRKLMGSILSRAEAFFDGKLIVSSETYEDICQYGLESRDSGSLYQLLQSIEGVEAIALLRQETPERCSVGLRSRSDADVGALALAFGGGGHKNAASFTVTGDILSLRPEVIKKFAELNKWPVDSD